VSSYRATGGELTDATVVTGGDDASIRSLSLVAVHQGQASTQVNGYLCTRISSRRMSRNNDRIVSNLSCDMKFVFRPLNLPSDEPDFSCIITFAKNFLNIYFT
jgi:hypothetical protein